MFRPAGGAPGDTRLRRSGRWSRPILPRPAFDVRRHHRTCRLDREKDDYWLLARQPLHCLVFLLPLLGVYEVGVLKLSSTRSGELRNGADFWLRQGLHAVGLEQSWLLPVVVVAALGLWQALGRYRWSVSATTLVGMLAESLLFGVCLIVLGQLQDLAFRQHLTASVTVALPVAESATMAQAVSYVGAGIYEEVLFRLLLLPACYLLLRSLFVARGTAVLLAVFATSLLFSAAHYIGPAADAWSLYSFTFRTVAGVFFALLFVVRGFGVTVGAHAAYDLLVGLLLPGLAIGTAGSP